MLALLKSCAVVHAVGGMEACPSLILIKSPFHVCTSSPSVSYLGHFGSTSLLRINRWIAIFLWGMAPNLLQVGSPDIVIFYIYYDIASIVSQPTPLYRNVLTSPSCQEFCKDAKVNQNSQRFYV